MHTQSDRWESAIDTKLLHRLIQPPGVIRAQFANNVRSRFERWSNRLPLLTIAQRHHTAEGWQSQPLPIVYAQPSPIEPLENHDRSPSSEKPTVIQAKFIANAPPLQIEANQSETVTELPLRSPDSNQPSITAHTLIQRMNSQQTDFVHQSSNPHRHSSLSVLPQQTSREFPLVKAKLTSPDSLQTSAIFEALNNNQTTEALPFSKIKTLIDDRSPRAIVKSKVRSFSNSYKKSALALMREADTDERLGSPETGEVSGAKSDPSLPIVRTTPTQRWKETATPLVLSQPSINPQSRQLHENPSSQIAASESRSAPTASPSIVRSLPQQVIQQIENRSVMPTASQPEISQAASTDRSTVDIEALTDKVERKLMRRMVIERERRGWR